MLGITNLGGRYIFNSSLCPSLSALLIRLYLRFVQITSSFDLRGVERLVEEIRRYDLSAVVIIWHREFFLFTALKKLADIKVFAAVAHLPEYYRKVYKSLGLEMVDMCRHRSIIDTIKLISKPGSLFVIAVDGPFGPPNIAKPGAAMFSSRAEIPIIPAHINIRNARQGATWDERIYPLPFNHFKVVIGTSIRVNPKAKGDEIYKAQRQCQDALNKLV